MISRLFSRRTESRLPDGLRVYAIGDIHGRLDLLDALIDRIEADDAARGDADTQLIFLGDLIDRGPNSAQVVERSRQLAIGGRRCSFLLGNHEEVFLQALAGDVKALAFFTKIGGRETILSYGIDAQTYRDSDYHDLLTMLQVRVPPAHVDFLNSFEDLLIIGDYAFVHAGIRPHRPLDGQKASDLRWIRGDFLDHRGPLEKIIVHGHTVSADIEERSNRIGLDTGAYASGILSAMGFEAGDRWSV